jgi:Family of unknown function (DUF5681)
MTGGRDDDPTDRSHPLYDPKRDPTHQSYEADAEDDAPRAEPSEDAYKVGPGFPPKESRWKKGCPSPFPSGRPKKIPSMKPDLKKAFEDALFEKVEVKKGDKKVFMTKIAVCLELLVQQAAKGDRYARADLVKYAALLGVDLQAKNVLEEALGINDQAIVDSFLLRQQRPSAGPAQDDHVKAPPDLIDDDVTKPAPDDTPASPPQPGTSANKQDEPVLDDDGRPLPVSDIRYVREMNRRKLAQQHKNQGES